MPSGRCQPPWGKVVQTAAALAAAMGVGRFAFTPILPLMTAQAGLTPAAGASLATVNYAGQILGPLAVTPLLHHGYQQALAVASFTVFAAAIAAVILRIGFPRLNRSPPGRSGAG